MNHIESEKSILKNYGKLFYFSDLKNEEIQQKTVSGHPIRLMSLIKESEIEFFRNSIIDRYGNVISPGSQSYQPLTIDFIKKYEDYLEIYHCVEEFHFVPDRILRDDILFFYKIDSELFLIVKERYAHTVINSEHAVFGMIDFSEGKTLLLKKNKYVKQKMKIFHKKIENLAVRYSDILFMTVSDSVIIKYSFKIIDKENKFQSDKLDFCRIIDLFKEMRKIVQQIFQMKVYGIFTYGKNKCETLQSSLKNIFHTGILSIEFKKVMDIEKTIRKHGNKADIYLTHVLYKSFRYYLRKNQNLPSSFASPSSKEWGVGKTDIVAMDVPEEPLIFPRVSK